MIFIAGDFASSFYLHGSSRAILHWYSPQTRVFLPGGGNNGTALTTLLPTRSLQPASTP